MTTLPVSYTQEHEQRLLSAAGDIVANRAYGVLNDAGVKYEVSCALQPDALQPVMLQPEVLQLLWGAPGGCSQFHEAVF